MWISFLDVAELLPHLRPPRGRREDGPQAHLRVHRRRRPRRASRRIRSRTSTASGRSRPASSSSTRCACRRTRCVGEEGQGFEIAMNAVENGRLGVAARAVGLSQACVDVAIDLREGARRLQAADRQVPDGAGDAQQHDLRHRGRAPAHLPARAPQGPRRARARRGVDGEDDRLRRRARSRRRTRSRSTAPTASPTSIRSRATCATRRCSRSSRATTSCTRRSSPRPRSASTARARRLHLAGRAPPSRASRRSRLRIFPVGPFGSSAMKSTDFGFM